MKIIIVGGVAGGATAAARIRRLNETADITVFEKSRYISYANCGLPYYAGGVITDPDELILQSPESFWDRFHVEMRIHHEVLSFDASKKSVTVKNLETGEVFEQFYDKLILATGARPVIPNISGVDNKGVFTLRTVEDVFSIRGYIDEVHPKSAVIVGGGFVGLELVENLSQAGCDVSIVEGLPQLMNTLDSDMAAFVHSKLRKKGLKLLLGQSVSSIEKQESCLQVKTADGESLSADIVIMSVGVRPESDIAKAAGLTLTARGHVVVNDRMETSVKDVYAVGDMVQIQNIVSGDAFSLALAGPANRQARVVADVICGIDSKYAGAQGSSVLKLFDMTVASTGLNEKALGTSKRNYDKIYLSPMNHAGYYPGGEMMTMKVLYDKDSLNVLGAQIVGGLMGVDKRIDTLGMAIRLKMSILDLQDMELAYAPPYGSAKDPINMVGYMADNIVHGRIRQFFWHDLDILPRDGSINLLDVRTVEEFDGGNVSGFVNIPVDELRDHLDELDKGKETYVMCQSGLRSYIACCILRQQGFSCLNLSGGYRLYKTVVLDQATAISAKPCGME